MTRQDNLISLMVDSLAKSTSLHIYLLWTSKDMRFEFIRRKDESLATLRGFITSNIILTDELQKIYSERYDYYFLQWHEWSQDKLLKEIRRNNYMMDGRFDAFVFAVQVGGDEMKIQEELNERIERLEEDLQEGLGHAQPTASPRMYQDGYRGGLQEILTLIHEHQI